MLWPHEAFIVPVPINISIDLSLFRLGFRLICQGSDYNFVWWTKESLFALEISRDRDRKYLKNLINKSITINYSESWLLLALFFFGAMWWVVFVWTALFCQNHLIDNRIILPWQSCYALPCLALSRFLKALLSFLLFCEDIRIRKKTSSLLIHLYVQHVPHID